MNKNSFAVFCRSSVGSCSETCEHGVSAAQSFQITGATPRTVLTVTIQAFSEFTGLPRRLSAAVLTIEVMMPAPTALMQTAPPNSQATVVTFFITGTSAEHGITVTYVSKTATFDLIF